VLALAILVRGRRRRAAWQVHEAYLDDLVRGPATDPEPMPLPPIEAILINDAEPLPLAPPESTPESHLPEPAAGVPPAAPIPAPAPAFACKADQLAVHVAELAAQTAALTDAVMDLVARAAIAQPAPAPPEPAPPTALDREPDPEPEPVHDAEPEEDPRVRELVFHPPTANAYDDGFDWPSENDLRAFARRQPGNDDGV